MTREQALRTQAPHAVLYGDVDLNIIDGSAVWAQSTAQALAAAGFTVTVLLKAPVRTDRLTAPIAELPGVRLCDPFAEGLAEGPNGLRPGEAADLLARLHAESPAGLVLVRGRGLAVQAAQRPELRGLLWTYLTDVPQDVAAMQPEDITELTDIALASRYLLCQTEELRSFLEASVPAACGRCVLFPPVVSGAPDIDPADAPPESGDRALRLVYSGKFAPRWNTLPMTRLPAELTTRGVPAELHMIGDKVHNDQPRWAAQMRKALNGADGVVWHGGLPRSEALRLAATCDIGVSWRSSELDASLELSTKVLELGTVGLPVVLNRTPMHERLLGADYPLFVDAEFESVVRVLSREDRSAWQEAGERCREAAQDYTLQRAGERLRRYWERSNPAPGPGGDTPVRLAIAGHDLKFFTRLAEQLEALPGVEVRLDEWDGLDEHDPAYSKELAAWADVVVCEWCGPNALFYARHKRRDQRLVVRLHRFELYSGWPAKLDISRVDTVVCVSPYYAAETKRRTGWPSDKVVVIPNWVDDEQLDRPKLSGAEFNLGLIGAVPARKRLDRALDVLQHLREVDPRYTLSVKSKQPWEYWWVWQRPEERDYFERTYRRIQRSPLLADAVAFDPHGPDVATWLRRVGFVLSTSDDESFHLAPAEGAASGAIPAVLEWPGAETIYARRWIHDEPAAMAKAILDVQHDDRFAATAREAQQEITGHYGLAGVARQWTALVTGADEAEAAASA